MTDGVYERLREFLDQFPIGFPKTASGVEMRILRRLFTPEQAEVAVLLSPVPEEAAQIAARSERDGDRLTLVLEGMADDGLVLRLRRKGRTLFQAAPFMIGIYEYSVKKIDPELAALFKEYYDTAFQTELGASNIPGFKVIPVGRHIAADMTLLPYHRLEEEVRAARKISVAECICRKEARLLGHACDHPMETCLSFGVAAEYYIETGLGREISAEEALGILKAADESGLVHAGANSKHLSNICNCCPCCCASLKGIVHKGHDKRKYINALYEAMVDQAECTACETCLDRCPVGAIVVEDTARVDRDRCLGCGLCAGACPAEAISLHLRADREEPFDRVLDMGVAILEAKRRGA
jgi:Pyruvate/2-oxoacid:ferredoxin oxidoreductase delta subunit